MINVDKTAKMLLYKLGRQGHRVSLIKEHSYNQDFDSVSSRYKLTFWKRGKKTNKKTGEEKETFIPETHDFKRGDELLRYMAVRANERKAESVR